MKQLLLLLVCIASFSTYAFNNPTSEKGGKITGTVIDKKLQEPIPYVTVAIKTLSGDIITGGVTDDQGKFSIEDIPEGKSMVDIQYIGYKTYSAEIEITRKNSKLDLGRILLEEDIAALDEVTIIAETTTIQQKVDRKVITIGKDLVTAGPTAADIMNNLPSVSVDQQTGDIALRGNQNVRVMVDGKLSNVPVAQLLKQLPTASIKQIELITNPSAKYNPEGMSGIINIILHKNVTIGFNGSASVGLTYQEQPKFNSSINLNYRNGKFNMYGNWGHNTSVNENFGNILRVEENSEQFFKFDDDNSSNLFKVGVDFYLNDKNTISVFTNQNLFDGGTSGSTDVIYYDNLSLNQFQNFTNYNESLSSQYNFDYKLDFEKDGHNIELEVDYNTYGNDEDADFKFTGAAFSNDYTDIIDTDRDRTTVNLDYVNPLSETVKIELGLEARLFESNISRSSNQLVVNPFNVLGAGINTPSTDFDYTRDIYSAYATVSKSWEKISLQVGLRAESVDAMANTLEAYPSGTVTNDLSNIDTNPAVTVSVNGDNISKEFKNEYFEVYPSAFFTYNPSEKNQYQVSYSRRIDRPGLSQINPIREWATPLISSFGNTSLEPQFTNSFEANYTRSFEKGSITGGVFYRIIENEINRAVFVDRTDLNRLILTHDNYDNTSAYGIELSTNYRPFKFWSINASFDLYTQTQTGITESLNGTGQTATTADIITEKVEVDNTAWNLRMFNNFKVTKTLSLSAFGFYRGKNKGIQFEVDPMYFVNLGARLSIWEGKGTFSVNYNDIFDTMKFAFDGQRPFKQIGSFNWESNTWNVALSYRFGGGKYRAKSRKRRDNNEKSGGGGLF